MLTRYAKIISTLILFTSMGIEADAEIKTMAKFCTLTIPGQDLEIVAEIAENPTQREKGLMYRKNLPEKQGMLFIYDGSAARSVWMKNTLLPLDVLFLDGDGRIVSFLENLQPCRQLNCGIFTSDQPARYMLEVNAGFISEHHMKTGDSLRISYP